MVEDELIDPIDNEDPPPRPEPVADPKADPPGKAVNRPGRPRKTAKGVVDNPAQEIKALQTKLSESEKREQEWGTYADTLETQVAELTKAPKPGATTKSIIQEASDLIGLDEIFPKDQE